MLPVRRWATVVGHIIRLAAYLCASRHGIFYFRFPLPVDSRPARKRHHIKVLLGTREPRCARQPARVLAAAGQSLISQPMVRVMRYDQMRDNVREHFGQMLLRFGERSAAHGPASGLELDVMRTAQAVADGDVGDWLDLKAGTRAERRPCSRRRCRRDTATISLAPFSVTRSSTGSRLRSRLAQLRAAPWQEHPRLCLKQMRRRWQRCCRGTLRSWSGPRHLPSRPKERSRTPLHSCLNSPVRAPSTYHTNRHAGHQGNPVQVAQEPQQEPEDQRPTVDRHAGGARN